MCSGVAKNTGVDPQLEEKTYSNDRVAKQRTRPERQTFTSEIGCSLIIRRTRTNFHLGQSLVVGSQDRDARRNTCQGAHIFTDS